MLRTFIGRQLRCKFFFRSLSTDGQDWGLKDDGSRNNIIASNLQTTNPSVTHPNFPEEDWRELAVADHSIEESLSFEVRKKKLRWVATKRGWTEAGEFLSEFVDQGGLDKIQNKDSLLNMERLLKCDDMFLMGIICGTKSIPKELNNDALVLLKEFSKRHF
jgi:succinate dehydrogenase flavin-adding protein (antitoxin of CptAB toxin-antitoxin module)